MGHAHRSWHQAAEKSRGGGTICRLGFKCVWRLRRVAASCLVTRKMGYISSLCTVFWQPRLSLAPVKGAARRACLRQVGVWTSFGLCPLSIYSLASHRALENSCVQPLSRSTFGKCDFGFSPELAFKCYDLARLSVRTCAQ